MRTRQHRLTLPAAALAALCARDIPAAEVRLTLSNPTGSVVTSYPVSIGVPFAAGDLPEPKVCLLDSERKPVPMQHKVLARWWGRDKSVSALLVTFMADTRQPHYVLRHPASADARPPSPVSVERTDSGVVANTGVLKAVLREKAFNVLDQVSIDLNRNGLFEPNEALLKDGGGALFAGDHRSTLSDARLTVEESGPIRAVVKAEGACTNKGGGHLLSYQFRFYFHAGSPTVQMDCTIIQDSDEIFVDIPSLGVELPLKVKGQRQVTFALEDDQSASVQCSAAETVSLVQLGPEQKETIRNADKPGMKLFLEKVKPYWSEKEKALWERDERIKVFSFGLRKGDETVASGKRASGICQVSSAESPFVLAAGLRWFWQLHPKGVEMDGDTFRLLLWPRDERRGPLELHRGTAKTHSFCLSFRPKEGAEAGLQTCRAFQMPPVYFPPPEQFRRSMLWDDIFPRAEGKFAYYEEKAKLLNRSQQRSAENLGGLLNFGDQPQGTGWWNNMETALDHGMFVQSPPGHRYLSRRPQRR